MAFELWLAYLLFCLLFAVTPGPAVLLTASQAIARGFAAGFAVVLGTQLGNLVYFLLSAAGIGAALATSPTAFLALKYAGALYLIWLGVRTVVRAPRALRPDEDSKVPLWRHPFVQGLANQLANPKSILFWGALFPQFVDFRADQGAIVLRFAILAVTGIVADIVVLSSYGLVAARGGRFLASGPAAVWRERLSGAALILVGAGLSLAG